MIYDLDTWCTDCIYYAKSTRSCDYFIIEDRLRGCPGGDGCAAKVRKKDVKKRMGKPRWDTEQGRQMYLKGMSDQQIGDHFGVAANTVLYQRQKYWEKGNQCTPPEDETEENVLASEMKEEPKQETAQIPPKRPELYETLEMATMQLTGIQAICTAEAISNLWNWRSRENLLKARDAIEYLLKKTEEHTK